MVATLKPELFWLVLTSLMTALLWVPYIINRIVEQGPWPVLSSPRIEAKAGWAERLMRAHTNAVENLVVFAPLVLATQLTGASTALTATATMVYFFARLVHVVVYTAAMPVVRTLAFAVAFGCQMLLGLHLLHVV